MKRVQAIDALVSAEIHRMRIKIGMTQATLADAVGITGQQLSKYEKGLNRVTCGRLFTIAAALGVQVADLFPPLLPDGSRPDVGLPDDLLNLDPEAVRLIGDLARGVAKL